MLIVGLIVVSHFLDRPKGAVFWVAALFTGLVWPQLAYLIASRARASKRAGRARP